MSRDSQDGRPKNRHDPGEVRPRLVASDDGTPKLSEGVPLSEIFTRELVADPHLMLSQRKQSAIAERYRRLATRLEQSEELERLESRVVVVSSAVPNEGKTTTAVNLALALAESKNRRVLLVDCDLRRPSIRGLIRPKPQYGVREMLEGANTLDHCLVRLKGTDLAVLPSGAPTTTPLDLVQPRSLVKLFAELRARFDWVIVDSPPTVPFSDASVLADSADGAILVVRAGVTARPLVNRALDTLDSSVVLGVVLNRMRVTPVDRYYYGYDDYAADPYGSAPPASESSADGGSGPRRPVAVSVRGRKRKKRRDK